MCKVYGLSIYGEERDSSIEPRYFTLRELTYTRQKFDNTPKTFTQIANLRVLADFLDGVREELGSPIFVNSAFRTAEVNAAVHGAVNSLHKKGRAADIWCEQKYLETLIDILRNHRTELSEFIVNRDNGYIHIAI